MTSFQEDEVRRLAASGWAQCEGIAGLVRASGLPAITREYLNDAFDQDDWQRAEEVTRCSLGNRWSMDWLNPAPS